MVKPIQEFDYVDRLAKKLEELYPSVSDRNVDYRADAVTILETMTEPNYKMCKAAEFSDLETSRADEDSFDYLSDRNAKDVFEKMINTAKGSQ